MSIREASERAPADAVFVPGHGDAYSDYSGRARAVVERFSPVAIAASIDEHYLDFRGCERLYSDFSRVVEIDQRDVLAVPDLAVDLAVLV